MSPFAPAPLRRSSHSALWTYAEAARSLAARHASASCRNWPDARSNLVTWRMKLRERCSSPVRSLFRTAILVVPLLDNVGLGDVPGYPALDERLTKVLVMDHEDIVRQCFQLQDLQRRIFR